MYHDRCHGSRDRLDHSRPQEPLRRSDRAAIIDETEDDARTTHVATEDEAGLRLDVLVARRSGAPRSAVAAAIKNGLVDVNGLAVKPSAAIVTGDVVGFEVPRADVVLAAEPEAIAITVVYEDDDLLVVDKPAGMVTHPAHAARDGTLVNAVLAHVNMKLPGDPMRPGLVHRLDRDTSGLLVVAKTDEALSSLGKAMMRRFISREYLGLVHGVPEHPEGTLDGAIGRDAHTRLKYAIRTDGKPAITHYTLREQLSDRASELCFKLETGRTHQIRVHLAAFGYPIVNDPVYGRTDPRYELPGQALHAWKLAFRHPRTKVELAFEADPPPEYVHARDLLRL